MRWLEITELWIECSALGCRKTIRNSRHATRQWCSKECRSKSEKLEAAIADWRGESHPTPARGDLHYDTTTSTMQTYTGDEWVQVSGGT